MKVRCPLTMNPFPSKSMEDLASGAGGNMDSVSAKAGTQSARKRSARDKIRVMERPSYAPRYVVKAMISAQAGTFTSNLDEVWSLAAGDELGLAADPVGIGGGEKDDGS